LRFSGELVAQFKLSRFDFAKTYRALSGRAPIDELIPLKMAHACRLLDAGGQSLVPVAHPLRYEDVHYVSRVFARVIGMPLSHYRALY
jgi:AraC-like DNA-binding protein